MYLRLQVTRTILMKFGISRQSFMEVPNIRFQAYPSSESRTDTCGQTDGHDGGEIGAFRE